MSKLGKRWYNDPSTGLPTIRRASDAREYQTPEEVKRMVAGGEEPDYGEFQGTCAKCAKPYGTCDHYD